MAGFRFLAFFATAIGIELARGAGLLTLAGAAIAGLVRLNPLFAIVPVVAGLALSLALPEDTATAGKVVHGLSNAPFLMLVYAAIGIAGFVAGRLVRFLRG